MLTPRCARRGKPGATDRRAGILRIALPLLAAGLQLMPFPARGAELFFVKILLNGQDKGEFLVRQQDDGDFLLRETDLKPIGLLMPGVPAADIDGEEYRPLRSMPGMEYGFNNKTLTLELTAASTLLPKQLFDFQPKWSPGVYFPDNRTVKVGEQFVDLTPPEFDILTALMSSQGRVYSRLDLLDIIQGVRYEGYERTIDTHIKNLRGKIEPDPRSPQYLKTVYGIGYRFKRE